MKITLTFAFVILLTVLPAHARIGESLDDIIKRYGQGEKLTGSRLAGTEEYGFAKSGFAIEVVIVSGRVVMEVFRRTEGPFITDEEIKNVLKINGEDHNWALDRRTNQWVRSDGKLTAYREPGHPDYFFIEDTAAAKQARAKSGKAVLEGF